ncbi:MAG: M3 family oligoendopeptidase [Anaerolineae bacterium]|jgi:oligoendopeptidase F|nr:M3 family oligoendopeptidase [Anaerolineae bacterium]
MFENIPTHATDALDWAWDSYQPYFDALLSQPLDDATAHAFLSDWSRLARLAGEVYARISVSTTVNTKDERADQRFNAFVEHIYPQLVTYNNQLNAKWVAAEVEIEGFEVPLAKLRADLELFREANLPLMTEESKLEREYDKLISAQTVVWDGVETTLPKLATEQVSPDRARREAAWRLGMERRLQDRDALNDLWKKFMGVRGQMAHNAQMPDYVAYRWKQLKRFDYTPADSRTFQDAIAQVVVPAAQRLYERQRQRLGLDTLRPWDTDVDATGAPALKPFETIDDLIGKTQSVFDNVDPALGQMFRVMHTEGLLDLDNRKDKAPGGYCTTFSQAKRPFIFMNAVGLHDDVQTLLHEGGHAFHAFEAAQLPYAQQEDVPIEFCEVASMGMELLASPYLTTDHGGYYTAKDAARARIEHLSGILQFWPYMAVVDSFQHWVYSNHTAATDPAHCDAKWAELWDRFMPGIDYSGLDDIKATGWHRKLHIFQIPFYYIEYGLAQLGAVQVFANALNDQAKAVADYRKSLALGGTVSLPKLFEAANVRFAFDADTLGTAVELLEKTITDLETV